jgi:type IV pilus assembly protein PilV
MKPSQRLAGFSLIEVLVTLVIVAVGLLGLAKLQAASLSNTQVSRVRSLVALQAASLAGAIRANPAFWRLPRSFAAAGTTVTDAAGVLGAPVSCRTQVCTPAQLAGDDLRLWAASLHGSFPGYAATIRCAGAPVNCRIELAWTEKTVAINRTTAATAAGSTAVQRFTLHVMP